MFTVAENKLAKYCPAICAPNQLVFDDYEKCMQTCLHLNAPTKEDVHESMSSA